MVHSLRVIVFLLVAISFSASSGEGAGNVKKKGQGDTFKASKKEPTIITSDRMEMDRKKNLIVYMGHVIVVRGGVTMRSETLTATYDPEMKRLREVVAEGKVQVTQGDRVATGAKAVFNSQNNTMTLTGNPVVRQGKSQVSGSRIILFINEDRGVVEGGAQRVKAVIFLEDLER
ncbi:MAG: lipopolysaccharide transport periplasmic protein LptA [Candidatus Binatia bacterium]